jgi:MFS family permease
VVGWIATMPIIVMASRLCPEGMEGTCYALIMSINNLGGIIGTQIGAWLTIYLGVTATNLDNFWLLVFICNISTLLPLGLIGWVPAQDPHDIIEQRRASTAAADYEAEQEP